MNLDYVNNFNKELKKVVNLLNCIEDNINIEKIGDDERYLKDFWKNIINRSKLLSERDEFLFCKEYSILTDTLKISIYEYYNNEKMDIERKNKLWECLEFMYLYAFSYENNLEELKYKLNNIQLELENKENSETLRSWLAIVDNMKNRKSRIENMKEEDEEEKNEGFKMPNISNFPKIDEKMFKQFEEYAEKITDGPIGKLAKDIADKIDTEDFNNPQELLSSLCSGNIKDSKLDSLIKTVGNELQNKLNNKDITQDDLMKDSMSILNNFPGMFNEDFMKNMNVPNNIPKNVPKNANANIDKNKLRKNKTRDRLLRKLEEKKNKNNN